jgi:uncharacterized protein (TIGR01319 family)
MNAPAQEIVLATDCGSTTTKAILITRGDDGWRLRARGEAPTTVEAPWEDVTRGVLNSVRELEELSGRALLTEQGTILKRDLGRPDRGCDLYVSTSSAGGGLQMMVTGVVKSMTAESAERAALGAGAIVMDVLASNDGRAGYERIERIRRLRPDMILLSGGVDGGTVAHVVELAELISAANPRARLGQGYDLPIIYAGNRDAAPKIEQILGEKSALEVVDNLRPRLEEENLGPAREKIHDLFMEHVMAQAPGYSKLMSWTDVAIMPTPGAMGTMIQTLAKRAGLNVIGVDIGGATTDVFSVFSGLFNRTVSANLGMSYSVSNVLAEAGHENVQRWLGSEMDAPQVLDRVGNKMIRPTTIPQTLVDLRLEQALAREALRLSFVQHKSFAVGLKGVQRARTISDAFDQSLSGETHVNMMTLDLLVGSGGALSHAPRRAQAALMLIDAFQPEGYTRLAVDSIFMMPHLGVLSTVNPEAALEVFERDCLISLGSVVAPVGRPKRGRRVLRVEIEGAGEADGKQELAAGELRVVPLEVGRKARLRAYPEKGFDLGAGPGRERELEVEGGVVGLILDGRGRPLVLPDDAAERAAALASWSVAVGATKQSDRQGR